jgi:isopentenyl-diphosphate delta-isomerase
MEHSSKGKEMPSEPEEQLDSISTIEKRKLEGIKIPLEKSVEARHASTYLEYVTLVHNALPEIDFEEIDTSTVFLKHKFKAPLLIDSMTGGTPLATKINGTIASVIEEAGLGMGVGSQRAGLKAESLAETYSIARQNAPTAFIAANIGGAQLAKGLTIEDAQKLVDMIKAQALIVHLNPLQELVQPEGESKYRGVLRRIHELVDKLNVPVIVKEVGAGISRQVAVAVEMAGAAAINVSGSGGTSWAGVEQIRAKARSEHVKSHLGELFWDWGIPTAAAILDVRPAVKVPVIGSGGLRNGLDAAKCLVLGADMTAMALPMLRAAAESKQALTDLVELIQMELRSVMFLTGSRSLQDLHNARYVLTGPLREWVESS